MKTFSFIATLLCLITSLASAAPPYVVSPKASDATKAAVAAGRPPQHGFPAIVGADWNNRRLKPGTLLEANIRTSDNVGYVEMRVRTWNMPLAPVHIGLFHFSYRVPWLPPFALGTWNVDVIARSVDGVETRSSYPLTYTYF